MSSLRLACRFSAARSILASAFRPGGVSMHRNLFGLDFSNPVGLGAGFDKNAQYLTVLEALGFGFVEIGTVTPVAQSGNEKPRLFRLPKDQALINRMGFNNDGAEVIAERLRRWRTRSKSKLIIGGNIGKNKITANEDAWRDYETSFLRLFDVVDYFVVNVSSPNTPGLRELQEKDSLAKILGNLQTINSNRVHPRPILLKIAPDLSREQLDDVIDLALEIGLDGLIIANTTISREGLTTSRERIEDAGNGGLSGKPLMEKSTEVLRYVAGRTQNKIPLVASGGIFTCEDAQKKFAAGAYLIQVWTGFIYEGPAIVKRILGGLSGR